MKAIVYEKLIAAAIKAAVEGNDKAAFIFKVAEEVLRRAENEAQALNIAACELISHRWRELTE
jgi:hypothetical protein